LIGDSHICADIKIEHGSDWLRSVKKIYRSGSAVIYDAEWVEGKGIVEKQSVGKNEGNE
jgi:hypothetical protein